MKRTTQRSKFEDEDREFWAFVLPVLKDWQEHLITLERTPEERKRPTRRAFLKYRVSEAAARDFFKLPTLSFYCSTSSSVPHTIEEILPTST